MKHWVHIGTQKAGSTFLRGLLAQAVGITLSDKPEQNFFGFSEDHSYQAYLACFPTSRGVLFENSPIYFRKGAQCAAALASTLADKRPLLSLFLRDPVEAIISHHAMQLRQGFFEQSHDYAGDPHDLVSFIRNNPQYLDRCRYMQLLEAYWLPHLPAERFAIIPFEEFTARPVETVGNLASRLGVDDLGSIETDRVSKNRRPASGLSGQLIEASGRVPVLRKVRHAAMAVPWLRSLAEQMLFSSAAPSALNLEKARAELTEHFRPDVLRLCRFLDRESLPWRNFFRSPEEALFVGKETAA